jgi:transposase InsO family protein
LVLKLKVLYKVNRETYGSPRLYRELKDQGFKAGRNRIARLMRENGLVATRPKRVRKTTDSSHSQPVAENVLDRKFDVPGPNRAWVTDITYIWTWEGWLYLAVVIDLFSRRVVGWSMAEHMRLELVLNALQMALGERLTDGGLLVHHSDRGSQYASETYRDTLAQQGIVCSMSRKGNCWDNAVAESFFATLKKELIARDSWPTRRSARSAIHEYITLFYNSRRRHSYLGFMSPMEYEHSFNRKANENAA